MSITELQLREIIQSKPTLRPIFKGSSDHYSESIEFDFGIVKINYSILVDLEERNIDTDMVYYIVMEGEGDTMALFTSDTSQIYNALEIDDSAYDYEAHQEDYDEYLKGNA